MGLLETLIVVILASSTSYQAGKAGQKVESYEQGKICFDQKWEKREAGCYAISNKPKTIQ